MRLSDARARRVSRTRRLLVTPLTGGAPPVITVTVYGVPRPQGSMRLHRHPSTGATVARYAPTVYEWRNLVTTAVRAAWPGSALVGPVQCSLVFELPRPRGHYGTGRNVGALKPSAPLYPGVAPDLDKLVRCVFDAVSDAGTAWHDDSQVVRLVASKIYVGDGSVPGCTITICGAAT
jgi:crossover junction endodeoxyribonuclease RusA